MPTVVDQAVCVRQWDWSETSQTVSLFARESGLLRALAKGSRRPKARFSGGLEPLTAGEMVAIVKPGPVLATLTAWDLRQTFPALRASLAAFHAGLFLSDLVQHSFTEHDPHPAVYDAFVACLGSLGSADADNQRNILGFQWLLLTEMGYRPDLHADILTGEQLSPAPSYGFLPQRGGLTADPGLAPRSSGPGGGGAAHGVCGPPPWICCAHSTHPAIPPAPPPGDPDSNRRANRLLAAYFREVLGRDLPSAEPFLALPGGAPP